MKNFKNTFLSLIDSSAAQAKNLVEDFNELVDAFDFDSQLDYIKKRKDGLMKKSGELLNEFAELLKQVKDSITDFSVTVPFDETVGEKISYEIKDNKLVIEVSFEDETTTRSNNTSVIIPHNCDLENINLTKNSLKKTATVTIPKIVREPIKDDAATPTKKPKKKVVRKKAAKSAETSEENITHISSKLADKLQQNASKFKQTMKRDTNGRFVRRTIENENA